MLSSKWAWLNLFQYCKFLRLLGHVMVLLVLGIVAFTYYTVVALQYGPGIVQGGFLSALGCTLVVVLFSALVSAAPRRGAVLRRRSGSGACSNPEARR
jgi:palmitoyltransferase